MYLAANCAEPCCGLMAPGETRQGERRMARKWVEMPLMGQKII